MDVDFGVLVVEVREVEAWGWLLRKRMVVDLFVEVVWFEPGY